MKVKLTANQNFLNSNSLSFYILEQNDYKNSNHSFCNKNNKRYASANIVNQNTF